MRAGWLVWTWACTAFQVRVEPANPPDGVSFALLGADPYELEGHELLVGDLDGAPGDELAIFHGSFREGSEITIWTGPFEGVHGFESDGYARLRADHSVAMAIGDFTGDGGDDLAVIRWRPRGLERLFDDKVGEVHLVEGPLGPGTHRLGEAFAVLVGTGDRYDDVLYTPGDLDGDGIDDLLVKVGRQIVVKTGPFRGEEPVGSADAITFPELGWPVLAHGDLDGDGSVDLLVVEGQRLSVFLHPIVGDERAEDAEWTLALGDVDRTSAVEVADVDRDGQDDLLVLARRAGQSALSVFLGPLEGPVELAAADYVVVQEGTEAFARPLRVLGDVDDDGTVEVLLTRYDTYDDGPSSVYVTDAVGEGVVALSEADTQVYPMPDGASLATAAAGDLDGDGRPDFAVGAAWVDGLQYASGGIYGWISGGGR